MWASQAAIVDFARPPLCNAGKKQRSRGRDRGRGRFVLIDRRNLALHRPWIALALIGTIAASFWFARESCGLPDWPGGGTPTGLTFGIVGGLLILFEFALWGRKKLRAWRIGRVKTWMAAHIWLGLLTVPLLVLHSGFRWGGSLSSVVMLLFLVVIASGVWGLWIQQVIPRRMLEEVPAETIHSQIDRLARFLVEDATRLVASTCGPALGEDAEEVELQKVALGAPVSHMTVGAVQTVGSVQGKVLLSRVPRAAVPGSEPLREIFQASIADYLADGDRARSPLAVPSKAKSLFRDLKNRLDQRTHEAVDLLENFCDQRRQLDRQRRLHGWMHFWLIIHLPLSVALVILMGVHTWVALKYR